MTKSSAKPAKSTQRYRNTPHTHIHTQTDTGKYTDLHTDTHTHTHRHIGRQKKLNLLGEFYLVNNLGKNSKWLKLASHII